MKFKLHPLSLIISVAVMSFSTSVMAGQNTDDIASGTEVSDIILNQGSSQSVYGTATQTTINEGGVQ
uniref:hypothetical protein n=1 Tax=Serratia marcescens TaxID=615 RepID=UPI0011E83A40